MYPKYDVYPKIFAWERYPILNERLFNIYSKDCLKILSYARNVGVNLIGSQYQRFPIVTSEKILFSSALDSTQVFYFPREYYSTEINGMSNQICIITDNDIEIFVAMCLIRMKDVFGDSVKIVTNKYPAEVEVLKKIMRIIIREGT